MHDHIWVSLHSGGGWDGVGRGVIVRGPPGLPKLAGFGQVGGGDGDKPGGRDQLCADHNCSQAERGWGPIRPVLEGQVVSEGGEKAVKELSPNWISDRAVPEPEKGNCRD